MTSRKNQPYVPGQPLWTQEREFTEPKHVPSVLHREFWELSGGLPVTVISISPNGKISGTVATEDGFMDREWRSDGNPYGDMNDEYVRPLQNRSDSNDNYYALIQILNII